MYSIVSQSLENSSSRASFNGIKAQEKIRTRVIKISQVYFFVFSGYIIYFFLFFLVFILEILNEILDLLAASSSSND